ncbi:MAG: hypothetical protein AB1324_00405 [Candidatus Micrarchaeota archaeon]
MESPGRTVSDLLQQADFALDSYDDIFSDFDPSPYGTRLVSADFLKELHRRYEETGRRGLVVNFTLPQALRSEKTEALVRRRLKEHFRERMRDVEKMSRERIRGGGIRILAGLAISLPLFIVPELEALPILVLFSVLMWYLLWSGLEHIFDVAARISKRRAFYERLVRAEYNFISQEEMVARMKRLQEKTEEREDPDHSSE